eukprot:scpid31307/ scgid22580/ 
MPIVKVRGKRQRESASLNLCDALREERLQANWPLAFYLQPRAGPAASSRVALTKSPALGKDAAAVLFVHGVVQCPAVCLRNPVDRPLPASATEMLRPTSGGSEITTCSVVAGTAASISSSRCTCSADYSGPTALISGTDGTVLFERVLTGTGSFAASGRKRSSGHSPLQTLMSRESLEDLSSPYCYDSTVHSTLRHLLASLDGDLARHAVRFQAQGQGQGSATARPHVTVSSSSNRAHSAHSAHAACRNVEEYIVMASCGSAYASPWPGVAADRSTERVAAWHVKLASGHLCLEKVSLELDGCLGTLHVACNVSYHTGQDLIGIMTTLANSGMSSKLRVRAIPAEQNVNLPLLHEPDQHDDGEGHLRKFLPLEAFGVCKKPMFLASLDYHCVLLGEDVSLAVTRVAESELDMASPYCAASRALSLLLLRSPGLLASSRDLYVCDTAITKQLSARLAPRTETTSSSSGSVDRTSSNLSAEAVASESTVRRCSSPAAPDIGMITSRPVPPVPNSSDSAVLRTCSPAVSDVGAPISGPVLHVSIPDQNLSCSEPMNTGSFEAPALPLKRAANDSLNASKLHGSNSGSFTNLSTVGQQTPPPLLPRKEYHVIAQPRMDCVQSLPQGTGESPGMCRSELKRFSEPAFSATIIEGRLAYTDRDNENRRLQWGNNCAGDESADGVYVQPSGREPQYAEIAEDRVGEPQRQPPSLSSGIRPAAGRQQPTYLDLAVGEPTSNASTSAYIPHTHHVIDQMAGRMTRPVVDHLPENHGVTAGEAPRQYPASKGRHIDNMDKRPAYLEIVENPISTSRSLDSLATAQALDGSNQVSVPGVCRMKDGLPASIASTSHTPGTSPRVTNHLPQNRATFGEDKRHRVPAQQHPTRSGQVARHPAYLDLVDA